MHFIAKKFLAGKINNCIVRDFHGQNIYVWQCVDYFIFRFSCSLQPAATEPKNWDEFQWNQDSWQ